MYERGDASPLLYIPLHDQTRLKNDHLFWRDRHFLPGTGISPQAASAGLDLENPEIAQFYGLSGGEILGYFIESALNDTLYVNLFDTGFVRYFEYDVFFCNRHAILLGIPWETRR